MITSVMIIRAALSVQFLVLELLSVVMETVSEDQFHNILIFLFYVLCETDFIGILELMCDL